MSRDPDDLPWPTQRNRWRIYWNPRSHETWVEVLEPMPAENGMQYQLMGHGGRHACQCRHVRYAGGGRYVPGKDVAIATAWAVTVEPGGKRTTHHGTKVMVTPNS